MGDNKAHPERAKCLLNLAVYKLRQGSLEQARAYVTASEESLFAAPPETARHHLVVLIRLRRHRASLRPHSPRIRGFAPFLTTTEWEIV